MTGGGGADGTSIVDPVTNAVKVSVVSAPGLTGAGQPLDYAGFTGSGLGPRGQPSDYGPTGQPYIRTGAWGGFSHQAVLPDIRDTLTVADASRQEIGDVAHEDAVKGINIATQSLHGINQLVAAARQGGARGAFAALGGILSGLAPFAGPLGAAFQVGGALLGGITSFAGPAPQGRSYAPTNPSPRSALGGGVNVIEIVSDPLMADLGRSVASSR